MRSSCIILLDGIGRQERVNQVSATDLRRRVGCLDEAKARLGVPFNYAHVVGADRNIPPHIVDTGQDAAGAGGGLDDVLPVGYLEPHEWGPRHGE